MSKIVKKTIDSHKAQAYYYQRGKAINRKDTTMKPKQFVETIMSETFAVATPWLDHLEYDEDNEIVTIVCENGYTYKVNVAMDSNRAIILDVIKEVLRH